MSLISGGSGDDTLDGGAGSDLLSGGNGDDSLSGGTGDDLLLGQAGGDWLIYDMSQNLGSSDYYDGGSGYDTLVLRLTYGEFLLASMQQDIAAFEAYLAGWRSTTFEFTSFDLSASTIEDLRIVVVNNGPTARADAATTGEHGSVTIDVLYNDSDLDHLDALAITAAGASAAGKVFTDGNNVFYDAGAAFQWLAEGQEAFDTFTYTLEDLAGVGATASVTVTVTGENDPLTIMWADASGLENRGQTAIFLDAAFLTLSDSWMRSRSAAHREFRHTSLFGGSAPLAGGLQLFVISPGEGIKELQQRVWRRT